MTDTKLFAKPYNTSFDGFYFSDLDEYTFQMNALQEHSGGSEDVELEFIEGRDLDAEFFNRLPFSSATISEFFEIEWSDYDKITLIIASENGYNVEIRANSADDYDIDFYEMDSMKDFAVFLVEDGTFDGVPDSISSYIDYEALGRDLEADYSEIEIAGTNYIYRLS